jgi:predicted DNA-binding transcriptional regulator YafY
MATLSRLERLDRLEHWLKSDQHLVLRDAAEALGVSLRTINRDVDLLRDRGLPIEADRGRGGGVRLDRNWGVGRLNLSYPEAVDLLISISVAEQMGSPLFLANLAATRRQLIASFSSDKRKRVDGLKSRILIGATAATQLQGTVTTANPRDIKRLHQGFLDQRHVTLTYQGATGEITQREIEPHYLLLNYPVWYVLAQDHLRQDLRTFRCDRIRKVTMEETRFRLRPLPQFDALIEGNGLLK